MDGILEHNSIITDYTPATILTIAFPPVFIKMSNLSYRDMSINYDADMEKALQTQRL